MKICPLITQASLAHGTDDELLVREADDHDLNEKENDSRDKESRQEDIFINPDSDTPAAEEDQESGKEEKPGRTVHFLAKSYRGAVECLGESCRFHDDEKNECRFDLWLAGTAGGQADEKWRALRADLEKSWEFQKQSTTDLIGLFKDLDDKNRKLQDEFKQKMEESLREAKETIVSLADDNKLIIESISDTLAERTEEIEGKLEISEKKMEEFKTDISGWKKDLDKSIEVMGEGMDKNRKLVEELSENNSRIEELVENQQKSLAEEEKKRLLSEAKRLNNAGVMAYHNGQYEKARELFEQALEIDPQFTECYNNLGLTFTEMNDEEKATDAFKKAIELNPELAATYNNLGYVFYRLGSYAEAIEMYNEAIGRSKDNSSAYTNLGNAYYKLDRMEEAIEAWNKAVEIDPGNDKAKRNLKRFHAEMKEK
ncbi:MAG: tetratricopeptide repeat protein [Candidatus Krumholzibacteriota bacterium]|nr:tetratricopeptide repeat protein [Candidatus Krumholzibacteriota bacterium]